MKLEEQAVVTGHLGRLPEEHWKFGNELSSALRGSQSKQKSLYSSQHDISSTMTANPVKSSLKFSKYPLEKQPLQSSLEVAKQLNAKYVIVIQLPRMTCKQFSHSAKQAGVTFTTHLASPAQVHMVAEIIACVFNNPSYY